ncbi:MAG TPA: thiol:disulfide interchange protein DsbA/DsbL [Burkholderiales bacterium]|nr:thiol:disulfide interchange protein DsbA/DsbL [Burkholderiales bacterium]
MRFLNLSQLLATLVLGLALVPASRAQQPVEGKDYKLIVPAQSPDTGSKIEVIEFFSYACPHCGEFEPDLEGWLKHKPKDVEYRMVPMVFRDAWKAPAKLYYTLEAMGLVDRYHMKVYDAIHKEKNELFTDQAVKEWAKSVGIDSTKFNEVYDSFGIDAKLQRAATIGKAYGVQFTPAMAVNGQFYTGPSMVTNPQGGLDYPRFFSVLDQLIDMARGKPPAKKKKG